MTTYGFELVDTQTIAELNTEAKLYRHQKTGAELLSLENNDENKVFGVTFRTPPSDSTGLPHIMEHSVLCGSRKYPVKEPFVELLKGSLKTFLNAFTYPDKTCYPVASTNDKDFYNLVDVYLDAVFYPRITPEILQQEGWHLELDSADAPLTYKGVVFNEMKGAYASPDNLLGRYTQQTLFPDNTYGFDSGGDPKEIPNLTYKQFKEFHDTYYHPGNARIYFYGDDNPADRLKILDEYLRDFEAIDLDSTVALQTPFTEPRRHTFTYAADESEQGNKAMIAVNWLLPEGNDMNLVTALGILSHALVGTAASPLRKALIDSGLGEDIIGGGVSNHTRQMAFEVGLRGINAADADKVESLILKTLTQLATEGISADMLEASLNTLEFRLREQNTGSFPKGLALMLGALNTWLYNGDPMSALAFEKPLAYVKDQTANRPDFYQSLIREHLLNNPHRVTVLLVPDPGKHAEEEQAEVARLAAMKATLNDTDLQQVIADAARLQELQETPDAPEALAAIPHLTLADLDKTNAQLPIEVSQTNGADILYHDLFTNGIVYLDLGFDMHHLPQELLPYIPLFSHAFLGIGTESEDFVTLSQRIGRKTGGVWTSTFTSAMPGRSEALSKFFLRGKATMDQTDDLLAIMRDVLLTLKLDNRDRFMQMLLEDKAGHEASLIPSGHGVINSRLRARFGEADWASEVMGGVDNLFFVRNLVGQVQSNWEAVLAKLEEIRRILINRQAMIANITLDQDNWQQFQPKLSGFLGDLPAYNAAPVAWQRKQLPENEGLTIPAKVNYVGKGANLYALGYQHHGSISVINNFLRTNWLWEKVRVQGGAYGGFCTFDQHSGVYTYLSYRDPNLADTLNVYDQTGAYLQQLDLHDQELTKSIIGAIGQMDSYQLPDAKGYTSMLRHLIGYTDEQRQRVRDEILSTRKADFKAFGEVLDTVKTDGQVSVLGSEEAINKANDPNWLTVTKVL